MKPDRAPSELLLHSMSLAEAFVQVRDERDRLSKALDRATDQLVHASQKIADLEAALKIAKEEQD